MQGPRYSRLAGVGLKLALVLLALVVVSGCREERFGSEGHSPMEYQRMLDSSGKRVVIIDSDGQTVAKLRKRDAKYKVYDEQLAPVGFVSWETASGADSEDADAAQTEVVVRSIELDDAAAIEEVAEGTYELGAKLRIEKTDRGWAVFGPSAKLAGVFERTGEDTWRLRQSYEDDSFIEAESVDGSVTLVRDGEEVLAIRAGDLTPLELLAVELEELSMLHRVAVGAWMEHARP